jgi:autotransporter-associated beta strand protein
MKPRNLLSAARLSFPLASAIAALLAAPSAKAASGAWNVNADGNWTTAGSWSPAAVPGSATTDNTDVATFSFTLTAARTATVDTTRFIGGITFGNTSAFAYTLSGGSLRLNSGGVIQTLATNGNHNDTISSPIQISGTSAATASFTANATSTTSLLRIGAVTGSATTGNTTTLTLNGTNVGAAAGTSAVTGIIGNGAGGGTLALSKSGAGTWALSGANTYSGGTTLNGGIVTISNATSFGTGTVTVSGASRINATGGTTLSGGIIYTNAINVGTQTLTLQNPTTDATVSTTAAFSGILSGSGTLSLVNSGTNGKQGILAFTNTANTFTGNVVLSASSSGDEHFSFNSIGDGGNFTFAKNGNRQLISYTGSSDITFNTRQIVIATSMVNGGATDRQGMDGGGSNPVSVFQNNGTGTVTFASTSNMVVNNITSAYGVLYFGGTNTGNNTFAGTIGDTSGSSVLCIGKFGAGTWILSGSNTYQGNTLIAGGTLSVGTIANAATAQPLGIGSGIQLGVGNGGTSGTLSYTGGTASTNKQIVIGSPTNANAQAAAGSILNNGSGALTFTNATFNPTSTSYIQPGTVNAIPGNVTVTRTLTLGGTAVATNEIQGVIQNNAAAGPVALAVAGSTWALSGLNTFTGNVTIGNSTLVAAVSGTGGNSALGSSVNTRTINVNTGGTLRFDVGNVFNNNFSSNTVPSLNINGGTVTNGGTATNSALGNVTLTGGTLTATLGSASGYGSWNLNGTVTSTGSSTISSSASVPITLSANSGNSNTTLFDVQSGTLTVSAALGQVTLADPLDTDNRISGFNKSGSGTLLLSGTNTYTGATTVSAGTLSLTGSVSDTAITVSGSAVLSESSTGVIGGAASLTHSSSGTSTLAGTNTYTGGTIVNAGTLLLSGAVDMPATGALQVNSGGTFSLADGTARTTAAASLSLADGARLSLDWDAGAVDTLVSTNAATTAGNVLINLNPLNSPSGTGLTLISSPSGGLGAANYLLLNNISSSLAVSDTAVQITSGAATPLTNAYWLGGQISGALGTMSVSSASSSNWASDSVGTLAGGVVPGAASDVFFSATGASQQSNVILGANMAVNSLTFDDPTPVTIGAGNTLTLNSAGSGSSSAISANQAATINSGIALGANSTWTVADATTLTVGGLVSGGFSLSKAGTGSLILNGSNTYSGGTTLAASSGSIQATITQTSNSLGTGPVAIGSGSSVLLNNTSTTNTANLPLISNVFTGTGLLQLQFAAGATGRNTYMPNVTGFAGTIQLSAAGTTGDKWNATALGTISGSLVIDSGAHLYVASGNTTFTGGITLNGTGNSENRGAIRVGNATAVVGGNITLASSSTISMEAVGSSLPGNISSGAAGTQILTLGGTASVGGTLSGIIGGGIDTLAVTTAVGGNYTLTGINTYTGDTTIAAGTTLTIGGAGRLGSGTYAGLINNSGTLAYGSTASQTLSGVISGSGALTKSAANTLTLSGANSYTGNTTVSGGTVNISNDTNTTTGVLIIAAGATVNLSSFSDYGVPSAMGSRLQSSETNSATNSATSGIGLLFQGGTLQYTGSTPQSTNRMIRMLNSTTNTIEASGTGSGTLTFTGAVPQVNLFDTGGTRTLNLIGSNTGDNTFGIPLTNQGASATSLVKSGVGKWLLTGASTHTGNTTINGGILDVNTIADSGTSALGIGGTLGLNSGILSYSGASAATTTRAVTLSANSGIDLPSGALTLSAGIAGNGFTLNKSSAGTLTLSGSTDNSSLFLNVTGGVVQLDKSVFNMRAVAGISGVSSGATVRLTGTGGDQIYDGGFFIPTNGVNGLDGTLDLNGRNESTSNFNGGATGIVDNTSVTACTFTVGNQGVSSTFSGAIQNTGANLSITKIGIGTLTLSGASTYSGATTVNAGTLTLGSASALGTSAATVNNTGTLNLNGQDTANTVSVSIGGTLTGNGSTGATTLAGSVTPGGSGNGLITMASATVAATSAIALQLPATGTRGVDYDAITVSGPLALDGTITVSISGLTPTIGQSFDLVDSTGAINVTNFTVATDLVLPALGVGMAWDRSAFASTGVVSIISADPYFPWADSKGLTVANNGKAADPDGDGKNNLYEFAFDGNPLSGANDGKIVGKIGTVGVDQVMTLTLPVRNGALFSAPASTYQISGLIDGLYYRIEGDETLVPFADPITEVTGGDATTIQTGLPLLSTGWTYRTFRAPGTVPTVPKAFLRAKISD